MRNVLCHSARLLWHKQHSLGAADAVIIPGGFSYGDYLRTGAIARFSPVMQAVRAFASNGGLVFGVCNGFQILCEAGLLPAPASTPSFGVSAIDVLVVTPVVYDTVPAAGASESGVSVNWLVVVVFAPL